MMGLKKTKNKMAFAAKHWKRSQKSPKHPLTLVDLNITHTFVNYILEKGRSEGKKAKRGPSYMLMWLDIQPYQTQLKNNIIKNKNNWCETNDMGTPSTTEGHK